MRSPGRSRITIERKGQPLQLEILLATEEDAGKVVVLSVDIDDKEDSLKRYLTRHPLPYEVLLGGEMDGPVGKSYNVRGAPLNVVIDPKGAVRYVEFGFEPASPTEPPPLESFLRSVVP
jgi:hypothetical protein